MELKEDSKKKSGKMPIFSSFRGKKKQSLTLSDRTETLPTFSQSTTTYHRKEALITPHLPQLQETKREPRCDSPKMSQKPKLPPMEEMDRVEAQLLENISKQNPSMRRKINYDTHKRPVKATNQKPPSPSSDSEEVTALKKRVEELEKMQDMYKARINELEQQVGSFSMFHLLNNPVVKEISDKNHLVMPTEMMQNNNNLNHNNNNNIASTNTNSNGNYKNELPSITNPQSSLFEGHKRKKSNEPAEFKTSPKSSEGITIPLATEKELGKSNWLQQFTNFIKPAEQQKPSEKTRILALYDYNGNTNNNETITNSVSDQNTNNNRRLSFKEGEVMTLIRKSSKESDKGGWWVAELNGKVGRVPSNYVELLDSSSAFKVKVCKNFESQQFGDLALKMGELLVVLKTQENGWYLGEKSGKFGFFPSSCVERVSMQPSNVRPL